MYTCVPLRNYVYKSAGANRGQMHKILPPYPQAWSYRWLSCLAWPLGTKLGLCKSNVWS